MTHNILGMEEHLGIENIFCKYFSQKIGKNILKNIFDQIFTKNICNTHVLYHFGFSKTVFAVQGGNFRVQNILLILSRTTYK